MSTSIIHRYLLIDTTEVLADANAMSTEEIGRAWIEGLLSVEGGGRPADGIWEHIRIKQWTGRRALPPALRAEILARDGEVCRYCGDLDGPFEIDHVHPVSRGGTDDPENLAVACEGCNRAKGAKPLAEWMAAQ